MNQLARDNFYFSKAEQMYTGTNTVIMITFFTYSMVTIYRTLISPAIPMLYNFVIPVLHNL